MGTVKRHEPTVYAQRQAETAAVLERALVNNDQAQDETVQRIALGLAEANLRHERKKAEESMGFTA